MNNICTSDNVTNYQMSAMEKVALSGRLAPYMMAFGEMTRGMDSVNAYMSMETFMKEAGETTSIMDSAY